LIQQFKIWTCYSDQSGKTCWYEVFESKKDVRSNFRTSFFSKFLDPQTLHEYLEYEINGDFQRADFETIIVSRSLNYSFFDA
jgi:hypothetical protein